jgi:hypothetical protein
VPGEAQNHGEWSAQACHELVVAVIDLAVEDARGRHGEGESAVARAWLFDASADHATPEIGTFRWYAALLGIDVARARRMIRHRLALQGPVRFPGRPYGAA